MVLSNLTLGEKSFKKWINETRGGRQGCKQCCENPERLAAISVGALGCNPLKVSSYIWNKVTQAQWARIRFTFALGRVGCKNSSGAWRKSKDQKKL